MAPATCRRPSMDWPLSREERKCQALSLYERDVQTCNNLLEYKDKALEAAKEEIKVLRRASLASTTTAGASSSPDKSSPDDHDDSDNPSPEAQQPGEDSSENVREPQHNVARVPAERECVRSAQQTVNETIDDHTFQISKPVRVSAQQECFRSKLNSAQKLQHSYCKTADFGQHPTSRRSSSLEGVSSWWAPGQYMKHEEHDGATEDGKLHYQHPRSDDRIVSPHRRPGLRRSNSLEAASSMWGTAWKAVRNGARRATETATETARILAEETRSLADEAAMVFNAGTGSHDPSTETADHQVKLPKVTVPTDYIEWRVDLESAGMAVLHGLKLEPHVEGQLLRVAGVVQGSPLDAWNSSKVPVTVFLHPGSREKVMRRLVVSPGDELVAIDGEPLNENADDVYQRMHKCRALSFRRSVQRRTPVEAVA